MKHLIEKSIQTANKYRKRYAVSLATKATQIKLRYHSTLVRAVSFRIGDSFWVGCRKIGLYYWC